MSLYINFEPHSWYKGFAIKDNRANDYADYANKVVGYIHRWEAYTDDGMTYRIIERNADTLKQLKQQITECRNRETEKIEALYRRLEHD